MATPDSGRQVPGIHRHVLEIEAGAERPQLHIERWKEADVWAIYALERRTWPPWLSKPKERIGKIAQSIPKNRTHLTAKDSTRHAVVGIMSATRTDWDGDPAQLGSWDTHAGGTAWDGNTEKLGPVGGAIKESDYPKYQENGTTLVIMSSSVDPDHQGQGIASKLFDEMKSEAIRSGIQRIVGPFRPSGWGAYKLNEANPRISFEEYCEQVIKNSSKDPELRDPKFHDPWLEAAMHMGMVPLRVDRRLHIAEYSMTVKVTMDEFKHYRETYKPKKWKKINGLWECDEAGSWIVVGEENDPEAFAVYTEPNLWGEIPLLSAVPTRSSPE